MVFIRRAKFAKSQYLKLLQGAANSQDDIIVWGSSKEKLKQRIIAVLNPIWAGGGGGKMAPLRVFAKYLKNDLADLHETTLHYIGHLLKLKV